MKPGRLRFDHRQGVVHVIGPEQGATLPGMTVVAGDSHTSTHGAFAALAFGVGTSEVEHVLATQCLSMMRMKPMRMHVTGALRDGVTAKDLILEIIRRIVVAAGGAGCAQAETEGLDRVFIDADFEWRKPGCSMCLGMSDDRLGPGERCASTSNRNVEGRQGADGRGHLSARRWPPRPRWPGISSTCPPKNHLPLPGTNP